MKFLLVLLILPAIVGLWWFSASNALRNCYVDHVELDQGGNKYTGALYSGFATEKQVQLNDLVIDSYPECDQQVANEYHLPEFGIKIMSAQASD